MRIETLPSPGKLSNGVNLRNAAARAISAVELFIGRAPASAAAQATTLAAFFQACADSVTALIDAVAPTIVSVAIVDPNNARVTFSEPMDTAYPAGLPSEAAAAWFTSNGVGASFEFVLSWESSTVLLVQGVSLAAGQDITYTQPLTGGLRDVAGNLVATSLVEAITYTP